MMKISRDRQGMLEYEEYKKKVASLADKEYNKMCKRLDTDEWDSKMVEVYNKEIRKIIEDKIKDDLL